MANRYIGIRAPQGLCDAVERMATQTGLTRSQVIRQAIESYVVDYYTSEESEWKMVAWNFLGTDVHRLNFALGRSATADEFFSLVSRWVKSFDLIVNPRKSVVSVSLKSDDVMLTSETPKNQPKEKIISEIITDLEEKYMESIEEEL